MRRVPRQLLFLPVVALLVLSSAATALAAQGGIQVKPWVYDPGNTGESQSVWVTGQGEADSGNANQALYLTKNGATADNVASGATVTGVNGITLTELGFDYRDDGHCGAGAPRFDVITQDGGDHFFACAYGTHIDLGNGWFQVRFADSDAFPPVPDGAQVASIAIVFDEGTDVGPGFVYLDNIDVNGAVAGKPGFAPFSG